MLKTRSKLVHFICCLIVFLSLNKIKAQDNSTNTYLISFIAQLEKDFNVKFSYVDDDIRTVQIIAPKSKILKDVLENLRKQTLLKIKKLNERYYTVVKNTTISICGTVLDNFEKNMVNGATVEILDTEVAVITDSEGNFSLDNVPFDATVQIKYLGFKTLFIDAQDLTSTSPCKIISLPTFYQQLDEVVIYQFLTTGLAKLSDASIEISTKEFGILPGLIEPDVLQTVQALPGIKSIDETVSDINIRGATNDQNLILWDRIKVYQSGHFFGLISTINPYLTDKINVIKNGTSAQYGDGVSGVISMQSINDISEKAFGGAGFNLISGDAYAQVPINKKLAFQFSARRSITDFLNTPTYDQFFNRVFQDSKINNSVPDNDEIIVDSNFYFYDFTTKALYDINDNQKVRLSFLNINNNLDYEEANINSGETTLSLLDQTNLSFGGSLESQWTNKFSSNSTIYYTKYSLDSQSTFPDPQQRLDQQNTVLETAIKVNTNYKFSENIDWLNGYQFNEVGITNFTFVTQPPFEQNKKGVTRTHAIFSEASYRSPDEKLKLRAGTRLNYTENRNTFKKFILEPRLNLNYTFTNDIKVEVLGEFKNQTTNQVIDLEQNFLGVEKRRWVLSDDNALPITKSKQGSLGINYDRPKIYIGLEGFYKQVTGISTITQGFQNENQFNGEIGKYDVKGVEFLINKKTNTYSAWLSYTYNINNYTFGEIVPSSFPNNLDVRHTLTFAGTYTHNNFKISLGLNYRSGKPFTEPDTDNPIDTGFFPNRVNYKLPNSSRLPEYLRMDASAIYNFDIGRTIKATMGASVLNLINRENILNTYYRINDVNEVEQVESVSLGLTPNFSFRVKF